MNKNWHKWHVTPYLPLYIPNIINFYNPDLVRKICEDGQQKLSKMLETFSKMEVADGNDQSPILD